MHWGWFAVGAVVVVGTIWAYAQLSEHLYKRQRYGGMVLLTLGLIGVCLVAKSFG